MQKWQDLICKLIRCMAKYNKLCIYILYSLIWMMFIEKRHFILLLLSPPKDYWSTSMKIIINWKQPISCKQWCTCAYICVCLYIYWPWVVLNSHCWGLKMTATKIIVFPSTLELMLFKVLANLRRVKNRRACCI